ncbi:hypothetical protein JCM30197_17650 [Schleiferia thermophila]|nr:hypothetical protein JCM30197_17650 [Schleiferia thermophila]
MGTAQSKSEIQLSQQFFAVDNFDFNKLEINYFRKLHKGFGVNLGLFYDRFEYWERINYEGVLFHGFTGPYNPNNAYFPIGGDPLPNGNIPDNIKITDLFNIMGLNLGVFYEIKNLGYPKLSLISALRNEMVMHRGFYARGGLNRFEVYESGNVVGYIDVDIYGDLRQLARDALGNFNFNASAFLRYQLGTYTQLGIQADYNHILYSDFLSMSLCLGTRF